PRGGVTVGRSAGFGRPGGYAYGSRGFGYRGYGYVGPIRFIRPYYAFRPRFSIGFGIWAGFPFAYSYPYYYPYDAYPYGYPYDYSYGYPYPPSYSNPYPPTYGSAYPSNDQVYSYPPAGTSGSVRVEPGTQNQNSGGLSFDITPTDAEVFVDGVNVGTVGQFTPTSQPLGLTPGRHRIELRAPGYQTISFDADIVAGQVVPYQGTMQR
ncbi:MAG TPA: PEGA domain-containing protein, partial [Vicinamibacterales bacterium]|nr:PEGA domain-containing protein [Vicinamibacterales bacterium]